MLAVCLFEVIMKLVDGIVSAALLIIVILIVHGIIKRNKKSGCWGCVDCEYKSCDKYGSIKNGENS